MYTFLVILAVITAILLAIVVLIQESKGGGLASNVSGANSVLGVRQTTNFVEKATWTLAALLVVFSVATSFFVKSVVQDDATDIESMPATSVPALPGAGQGPQQAAPAQQQQAPAQQSAPAAQGQQQAPAK